MNRQLNYITSAVLLLGTIGIAVIVFSKISKSIPQTEATTGSIPVEKKETVLTPGASKGKEIFIAKCASCHQIQKDATGPALAGFVERGQWADFEKLYEWVKNPSAFMAKDTYTKELAKKYKIIMTGFPGITKEEVNAVVNYIQGSQ